MASQFTVYSRKQISVMEFNKYDIYFNLLDIYYKEDILQSKYDIHLIILDIQNVNIRYPQY